MAVLKDHKGKFGINFAENKQALNSISTITSKMLKNELAGYITKFIKNELRNETEKQNLLKMKKILQEIQNHLRMNQRAKLWTLLQQNYKINFELIL